ncbi:MAG: hypothetical protein A2580_17755 [Hydrogenophilales bacterium RIFOXYD1_FULL_62_11]|nr:MAG: hypothetical protein A2580_17755 [Hydrogenophilales bacterium RIFOXYD1_FULL_62_11]
MKAEEMRADYTVLKDTGAVASEWHRVRLGDIAQVVRGVTYKKEQASGQPATDMLPILRATNVQDGTLVLDSDLVFVPAALVSDTQKLRVGDIVIATSSGSKHLVGKTAQVREAWQGSFGAFCAAIRPTSNIDQRYLGYFFETREYKDYISKKALGVNINNLRRGDLEEISVPVAPLDQQKRIVAEIEKQFSRLDKAVANLKRVKANLKRYKAAVLKAAVEGRLVETEAELARREGRSYETGAQLLQRIHETRRNQWKGKGKYKEPAAPSTTDLPELPEGWVWAALPQLGELNRGKSKHRPRDDERLYGGPYPFIQTGDVRKSEGAITEYSQTYSDFGLQQSRLWPVGTLCITIAANIAETGILKFPACFPDSVVGFLIEDGATTTQYVNYFIRTAREKLERFAPATAQKNINLKVLEAVAIPLPPLVEQRRIVAEVDRRLTLILQTESQVDANLQRAERLGQSVLTQAFIGQVNHLGIGGGENNNG